ncbi:MAG: DUF4339 domain-containing protein [Halobacteriovoraceae bacterium]|nr:DUF4339 domain-containing protein [Halobacteriovoraceae bacterium]MCB9093989.1 DUF4339 domain-containing protein [Halobacteriovoraceae bacterium]
MSEKWYYVEEGERKGPISKEEIFKLMQSGSLDAQSFVWTKGYDNWKKIEEVDELENTHHDGATQPSLSSMDNTGTEELVPKKQVEKTQLNFQKIDPNARMIYLKTGLDRGGRGHEYGPFNLSMVKKLYKQNRINGKTLVFYPGLDVWRVLGSFEDFEHVFEELPPIIEDTDKRVWERKPFTARLFFTNKDQFFEGICKDLSLGGMKVLIDKFPGKLGEEISLNVHPEEEGHQFVAKAKIVRVLDDDAGFSLEFVDLNQDARNAISSYLATH